jgi:hypothetical protein
MVGSGLPALDKAAEKACLAPSSTLAVAGVTATARSLVTVNCALALIVGEAVLVAVTRTVAGEGKSAGAVKTPLLSTVPLALFPPGTPLTLQVTAELLVPVNAAVNCCVLPSRTLAVVGETTTEMVGGGGGLVPELAPPPPQPGKSAKAAIKQNGQPLADGRF